MLTERRIRDAKPEPKTRFLWDGQVKNLGVRITPKGAKSYVLFYRAAGRKHLATLARCTEVSLKAARERAGAELAAVRAGDPDPLERQHKAREAPTVAEGIDRFFNEFAPARVEIGRMAPRTVSDYQHQARRYIAPAVGNRKIADVTRLHVEVMVESLSRVQRNRVLALTSRLFSLFEAWEWRPQNTNPAKGIERAREEARDRILSPTEIAALSATLNDAAERHPAPVAAIRFAAVTGLRIGEVISIRWEHVSFESGRLTIPATKTGRRVHDLPAAALAILTELPRVNAWVFTTGGEVAVTYRWVRKVFLAVAEAARLQDVRLHDLRRTVMTTAAAAGVGTHVLRDLLGHRTTAMADRYVRSVGNPVRDARELVGAAMAAMMQGEPGSEVEQTPREQRRAPEAP